MRRLMLLRHAKTEHDAPSGRDQDRRLDNRGRQDADRDRRLDRPASAVSRSGAGFAAVRAHQTWEIAWEAMKTLAPQPQVELVPELYGADPPQLLQTIREASGADPQAADAGRAQSRNARTGAGARRQRRRGRPQRARRQPADVGPCGVRLFHRRLEPRGIPPRPAGAVRQSKAVEAGFGRLGVPPIVPCRPNVRARQCQFKFFDTAHLLARQVLQIC